MPFMSINDPEFWKSCPKELEVIQKSMDGTGGGVAYFVMGAALVERSGTSRRVCELRPES